MRAVGLNHYRQSRWDDYPPGVRPLRQVIPVRRGLFGVLLAALAVIMLYWPSSPTRIWLLPIPALDQPMLNQVGLLLIRLAVCWVVIKIVHRERTYPIQA